MTDKRIMLLATDSYMWMSGRGIWSVHW